MKTSWKEVFGYWQIQVQVETVRDVAEMVYYQLMSWLEDLDSGNRNKLLDLEPKRGQKDEIASWIVSVYKTNRKWCWHGPEYVKHQHGVCEG